VERERRAEKEKEADEEMVRRIRNINRLDAQPIDDTFRLLNHLRAITCERL